MNPYNNINNNNKNNMSTNDLLVRLSYLENENERLRTESYNYQENIYDLKATMLLMQEESKAETQKEISKLTSEINFKDKDNADLRRSINQLNQLLKQKENNNSSNGHSNTKKEIHNNDNHSSIKKSIPIGSNNTIATRIPAIVDTIPLIPSTVNTITNINNNHTNNKATSNGKDSITNTSNTNTNITNVTTMNTTNAITMTIADMDEISKRISFFTTFFPLWNDFIQKTMAYNILSKDDANAHMFSNSPKKINPNYSNKTHTPNPTPSTTGSLLKRKIGDTPCSLCGRDYCQDSIVCSMSLNISQYITTISIMLQKFFAGETVNFNTMMSNLLSLCLVLGKVHNNIVNRSSRNTFLPSGQLLGLCLNIINYLVGSPINNNMTNNECDIATILKYTSSDADGNQNTSNNFRVNLKKGKSSFEENDTNTSTKLSPLKASSIIIPKLANKDEFVATTLASLSDVNNSIIHSSMSNTKTTLSSTTLIHDNMGSVSIDIINNMIDITKKSKHMEACSSAIVQLGTFIISTFPHNIPECIDYHHQLIYRNHNDWSSLLSLILITPYQPKYDATIISNIFGLKKCLLAYLGDIIKDKSTMKVFIKNQHFDDVTSSTNNATTTSATKRKRSESAGNDIDRRYFCGELCKELKQSMSRSMSKRTVCEDIDQVPIQQLCAIWNSYTRSLDDAPVNLVKGDAFYNASLLVISLSKLFLYISSHLSTTHFNLLIEGTDHYMQFQFNRWANGNYHPSLKICEGDLREIESKFNGM